MADEAIVIVDNNGTEHEFPPGFDVQRAIEIVKGSGPHTLETRPGAADTPMSRARVTRPNSDLSAMAASDTANASLAGGRGFIRGAAGVAAHPLDTLGGILQSAADEGLNTIAGTYHLATAPRDTLRGAGHDIMTRVPEMFDAAVHKASTDPEGFGQDVGAMTANTAAGIALGGAARFAPKPLARGAGGLLDTIGKEAKWPIRMVGAHQLGSGNPMGLVTIALPEQLRKSGEALQRWGTEPGALAGTPNDTFLQVQQDLHKASSDPAIASQLSSQLDDLRAKLVEQRQTAKLPADLASVQKAQNRIDQLSKALQGATAKASRAADASGLSTVELKQLERQIPDPVLRAQVIERFKNPPAPVVPDPVARPPIRVTGPMQPPPEAPTGPVAPPVSPPIRVVAGPADTPVGPESSLAGPSKVKLSAPEAKEYLRLSKAGKSHAEIMDFLEAQRAFMAQHSLPTDAQRTFPTNKAGLPADAPDQGGLDALLRD